jgi:hypothetical protein
MADSQIVAWSVRSSHSRLSFSGSFRRYSPPALSPGMCRVIQAIGTTKGLVMDNKYGSALRTQWKRRMRFLSPILITTVGTGWLLTARGVIPGVQWVWVLVLAVLGAFVLFAGVDKVSVAVGPSLMVAAALSMLRQTGWIAINTEVPLLTMIVGSLWTAAYLLPVPLPAWIIAEGRSENPLNRG